MRVGDRRDPALELREHLIAIALRRGQEIGDIDLGFGVQLKPVSNVGPPPPFAVTGVAVAHPAKLLIGCASSGLKNEKLNWNG